LAPFEEARLRRLNDTVSTDHSLRTVAPHMAEGGRAIDASTACQLVGSDDMYPGVEPSSMPISNKRLEAAIVSARAAE
jgi:hypothetical protein